ncbi:hypothetical protein [Actinokineospora sp. NBRC 105648]|uniref:hypothetical protein n=1 Tax=Actinokineospora sp. NBRC 105648 TaxID=3032206 RepID=UPI0024A4CFC6|nr:hypothetical protein [Actinokineospora sp. NBRC 105648]GLZ39679.1 hypothetical protein Acsp05_33030 [Actinokineospora sp. NBRC 105648]
MAVLIALPLSAVLALGTPVEVPDFSYAYRYQLQIETAATEETLTEAVAADLRRFFPFDSNCPVLPPVGARCDLYTIPGLPLPGTTNPVQVVEKTKTSWTFRSLPGHIEGSDRNITFTFSRSKTALELRVHASGPWTPTAAATVHLGIAHAVWQVFADRVSAAY